MPALSRLPGGYDRQQLIAHLRAERAQLSRELHSSERQAAETSAKIVRLRKRLNEVDDGLQLLD